MSSYHGWTHARKEDGGTDPVPFPDTAVSDLSWGRRTNTSTQTIPSGVVTQLTNLDVGEVAPIQSDVSLITDGLSLDTAALWLVTLRVYWSPGFIAYSLAFVNETDSVSNAVQSEVSPVGEINRVLTVWPYPFYPGTLLAWVWQNSGSDQDVYSVALSAVMLGTYAGSPDVLS